MTSATRTEAACHASVAGEREGRANRIRAARSLRRMAPDRRAALEAEWLAGEALGARYVASPEIIARAAAEWETLR